jgi:hypothetical protein
VKKFAVIGEGEFKVFLVFLSPLSFSCSFGYFPFFAKPQVYQKISIGILRSVEIYRFFADMELFQLNMYSSESIFVMTV